MKTIDKKLTLYIGEKVGIFYCANNIRTTEYEGVLEL